MVSYRPRLADVRLRKSLDAFGAVLIEGPKWCGKTTTAEQMANSVLYFEDEDQRQQYLRMMDVMPSKLLEGENPRLIDEWQVAPRIWDAIRFDIDRRSAEGLYILTGSTSVDDDSIIHSGAGRIVRMKMGMMSLYESGDSTSEVSLINDLFEGREISGTSRISIDDMAELIVRGGWPKSIGKSTDVAQEYVDGYCKTILNSDISTVDGKKRDKNKMEMILRSLARNISTSVTDTKIARDIADVDEHTIHVNTVRDYIGALRKLFIVDDLSAWNVQLRSKATIRTSDKRQFCDPAIAAYFLRASPKNLIDDLNTYGFLFESLVVRDIRAYLLSTGGDLYQYHDSDDLEIDLIVHLRDGRWGAIEVKLGNSEIEKGALNLKKLKEKVKFPPEFCAVVTCGEFAYKRKDGVYVVPLGCLRP